MASCTINRFTSLTEEVQKKVVQNLRGYEIARGLGLASKTTCKLCNEDDGGFWRTCVLEEFGRGAVGYRGLHPMHLYRGLRKRELCATLRWAQVPCRQLSPISSSLGHSGAFVEVFACHGYLFVFAVSRADQSEERCELHGGALAMPLILQKLALTGSAPRVTSGVSVTLLQEEESEAHVGSDNNGVGSVRVLIAGHDCTRARVVNKFGILEIRFANSDREESCAEWIAAGDLPTGLVGHSATYVPRTLAGGEFLQGYVLFLGGITLPHSAHILDLDTLTWKSCPLSWPPGSGPGRPYWKAHSAILLKRSAVILVVGVVLLPPGVLGRFGDSHEVHKLAGLKGAEFQWRSGRSSARLGWSGPGHLACRIGGTESVLLQRGGAQSCTLAAVVNGHFRTVEVLGQTSPNPRTFAAGCGLPDGTLLFYGGSNLDTGRVYADDVWVAHVGVKTQFFLQVQKELSFLVKMQRRIPKTEDSSEDELGAVTIQQESGASRGALVDDLVICSARRMEDSLNSSEDENAVTNQQVQASSSTLVDDLVNDLEG